jgi:hypothetical protein
MNPPSAMEAATRLVCLTSLGVRSLLEDELPWAWPAGAMVAYARIEALRDWLRNERLLGRLSAQESKVMAKPIGGWSAIERAIVSWRIESAGVIAWSLGLLEEIPAYDTAFHTSLIRDVVPRTGAATKDFILTAEFRPEEEIQDARAAAESWLWRARTTRIQADEDMHTSPTPPEKYTEYVRSAARQGAANGWFIVVNDDFPAFGKAYADLSLEEYCQASSVAQERLWGLNWICGYARDWDRVPLET